MNTLQFPRPFDMHVHLRTDYLMQRVILYTSNVFQKALVMPNTKPEAILTPDDMVRYRDEINECVDPKIPFEPLMTFEIREDTDPKMIPRLKNFGAVAGKAYPRGLTTNAEHGIKDYFALYDVLTAMQEYNLVLCLHGEQPGDHIEGLDREAEFVRKTLPFIINTFPRLRVVMEHITTQAAVEAVLTLPTNNLAATITAHHLLLSHDDVGGDHCSPNNYCKPVAKHKQDRDAVVRAAVSGCPKFMFGSDSAPHFRIHKRTEIDCCAGVFSAPVCLPLIAEVFEQHNALDRMARFVLLNAVSFYRLSYKPVTLQLEKKPWIVPNDCNGIAPFWAGKKIAWQVSSANILVL